MRRINHRTIVSRDRVSWQRQARAGAVLATGMAVVLLLASAAAAAASGWSIEPTPNPTGVSYSILNGGRARQRAPPPPSVTAATAPPPT